MSTLSFLSCWDRTAGGIQVLASSRVPWLEFSFHTCNWPWPLTVSLCCLLMRLLYSSLIQEYVFLTIVKRPSNGNDLKGNTAFQKLSRCRTLPTHPAVLCALASGSTGVSLTLTPINPMFRLVACAQMEPEENRMNVCLPFTVSHPCSQRA